MADNAGVPGLNRREPAKGNGLTPLEYPECGAIALVGSGEYLPVMTALEGELLQAAVIRGKGEVFVQLPTAAGAFNRKSHATRGLALLPMIQTIPHYDRFLGWLPDRVSAAIMRVEEGMNLIGIDENTALVRDHADSPWRVWGEGKVHLLKSSQTHSYVAGDEITFP